MVLEPHSEPPRYSVDDNGQRIDHDLACLCHGNGHSGAFASAAAAKSPSLLHVAWALARWEGASTHASVTVARGSQGSDERCAERACAMARALVRTANAPACTTVSLRLLAARRSTTLLSPALDTLNSRPHALWSTRGPSSSTWRTTEQGTTLPRYGNCPTRRGPRGVVGQLPSGPGSAFRGAASAATEHATAAPRKNMSKKEQKNWKRKQDRQAVAAKKAQAIQEAALSREQQPQRRKW